MTRIAIIGAGISGLTAAFTLQARRAKGADVDYVLYEASQRLGGVLQTHHIDGCIVEAGPDSFLTEKPSAALLARDLGLTHELVGSNDSNRKTYILTRGRLVEMPDGLMFMVPTKILPTVFSPLFSWKTKLRMAGELFAGRNSGADESVASFVERHYGKEMVDRLADPLLSGIYGGDATDLSMRAVLPRFHAMENSHGSLSRATLAARKNAAPGKNPAPVFTTLKNGMQQLADALAARLPPASIRAGTPVFAIQPEAGGWTISAGMESDHFDAVILALPAPAAAQLLQIASPALAAELAAIHYTSSITVALAFDRAVRERLPSGFGFLVPRSEGKQMLAATFVHNKFPHRAPDDRALLRCFFGGRNAGNLLSFTDEEIIGLVRKELQEILGPHIVSPVSPPLFSRVFRWNSAMAQYSVGHLDRLERIARLLQELPGLALAGNACDGIGIPDCIRSGGRAAEKALLT